MDKNSIKVSNLYGRARRIEFVEKVAYLVIGIIAVILVIVIVSNQKEKVDDNVNFAYLRRYLENRGFNCEMIHRVGGQCSLVNDTSTYSFIRYDDGFEYIMVTKSYTLDIRHKLSEEERITFKTTSEAFSGYRNKSYTCRYKDKVVGELDKCIDEDEKELDLNSYKGMIEKAIVELNNIIDSSGYDKDELLDNYKWTKK